MKAMIFAAGHGTRLKPLTDNKPKALVLVNKKTLLEHTITRLKSFGINEIIINVHAFADQIISFLDSRNRFDIRIEISDERDLLLDTGGGLKKAAWFFNDDKPFIVHNVDIISDININELYQQHLLGNGIATLAVSVRESSRYFLINSGFELCGWYNAKTNQTIISKPSEHMARLAFSGVHIIEPRIFQLLSEEKAFSITDQYLDLSKNHKIMAYIPHSNYWFDVGNCEKLKQADNYFSLL